MILLYNRLRYYRLISHYNVNKIYRTMYRRVSSMKKYKANLTEEEKNLLLHKLSTLNSEELSDLYVSPILKKAILNEREIIGSFNSLADLHSCGFDGAKQSVFTKLITNQYPCIEELQNIIGSVSSQMHRNNDLNLNQDNLLIPSNATEVNDQTKKNNKGKVYKKSLKNVFNTVSNNFTEKNFNSITAICISLSHISWTNINMDGKVQDLSSIQIFSDHKTKDILSMDDHTFYNKVLNAILGLPPSDLYVTESYSRISFESSLNRLFYLMKGMLLSLLDSRKSPREPHPLVYLKKFVVSKIFDLKVGMERKSCIDIGESILSGNHELKGIPDVSFDPKPLQKYILSDYEEKIQLTESLLLAIAFDAVVIKKSKELLSQL